MASWTIAGLMGVASIFYVGVQAPSWHLKYIENKVGRVTIKVLKEEKGGGGSGFHVRTPKGKTYIMTNIHVCAGAKDSKGNVLVQLPHGGKFIKRKIVKEYSKHDLCLVEPVDGFNGIEVADKVTKGQELSVVGHPYLRPARVSLGQYLDDERISLLVRAEDEVDCAKKKGHVEQINMFMRGCVKEYDSMETNITIFPGSSGSAVVNFFGQLSGVVFAGDNNTNYGFLVPLSFVKDFLKDF